MISIFLLLACGDEPAEQKTVSAEPEKTVEQAKSESSEPLPSYEAVQEPLVGGPYPGLLVTQAWFRTGPSNKPVPGPARLEIWREKEGKWDEQWVEISTGGFVVTDKSFLKSGELQSSSMGNGTRVARADD